MDKEEARHKEAERTLKRIRGTLRHLEDGSAWQDPVTENEEFRRMKQLLESGYAHDKPATAEWLRSLIRRPAILIMLAIAGLVIIELLQR